LNFSFEVDFSSSLPLESSESYFDGAILGFFDSIFFGLGFCFGANFSSLLKSESQESYGDGGFSYFFLSTFLTTLNISFGGDIFSLLQSELLESYITLLDLGLGGGDGS
jgi:hypothetical protein